MIIVFLKTSIHADQGLVLHPICIIALSALLFIMNLKRINAAQVEEPDDPGLLPERMIILAAILDEPDEKLRE